jgi:hypothetical protein
LSEVEWKAVSLALDSSGNPVMAVSQQEDPLAPRLVHCSDTTCSAPAAVHEISDRPGATRSFTLLLRSGDLPMVAHIEAFGGDRSDVVLTMCTDPICADRSETIVVDNGVTADWISLVLGEDGMAYVSYHDAYQGDLRFARVPLP